MSLLIQGNFDSFVKTRSELEENQMKQYQWEQDQISHMKVGLFVLPVHGASLLALAWLIQFRQRKSGENLFEPSLQYFGVM